MEVLLKENVYKLGGIGDVVKVKAGYARNFLLPKGKALRISEANKNEIERQKKILAVKKEEELVAKRGVAEKLKGITLEFTVKANEDGNLYGSVSEGDIAKALKEKGFSVERKNINLSEPIKVVGEFEASIHLAPTIEPEIKIIVQSDEQQQ